MKKLDLTHYRNTLLEAGIPFRKVLRNVRELKDHYADLVQKAGEQGMDEQEASSWAAEKIGDLDLLAREMIARSSRGMLHRHPMLMTLLLPPVSLCLFIALMMLLFVGAVELNNAIEGNNGTMLQAPLWLKGLYMVLKVLLFAVPVAAAIAIVRVCTRGRILRRYWVTGLFFMLLIGSGLNLHVSWPDSGNGDGGSIGLAVGYALSPIDGSLAPAQLSTLRLIGTLMLCGGVLMYMRRRDAPGETGRG